MKFYVGVDNGVSKTLIEFFQKVDILRVVEDVNKLVFQNSIILLVFDAPNVLIQPDDVLLYFAPAVWNETKSLVVLDIEQALYVLFGLLSIQYVLLAKVVFLLLRYRLHIIQLILGVSANYKCQGLLHLVYQPYFVGLLVVLYSDLLLEVVV